jgi:hypothetical protein
MEGQTMPEGPPGVVGVGWPSVFVAGLTHRHDDDDET